MTAAPCRDAAVRCRACRAVSAPRPGSPGIHAPSSGAAPCGGTSPCGGIAPLPCAAPAGPANSGGMPGISDSPSRAVIRDAGPAAGWLGLSPAGPGANPSPGEATCASGPRRLRSFALATGGIAGAGTTGPGIARSGFAQPGAGDAGLLLCWPPCAAAPPTGWVPAGRRPLADGCAGRGRVFLGRCPAGAATAPGRPGISA